MLIAELVEFRNKLELSPEAFGDITGVNWHRYRRGKLKDPLNLGEPQIQAIRRCTTTYELAVEVCGNRERALDWLYAESPALGGLSPLDLADQPGGLERVQNLVDALHRAVAAPVSKPVPPKAQPVPPVISQKVAEKPRPPETVPQKLPDGKIRISEALPEMFRQHPEINKAELARRVQSRGVPKFSTARASHLSLGYADASHDEIFAIAQVFQVEPTALVSRPQQSLRS